MATATTKKSNTVDVRVDNHGSIVLLTPISQEAKDWIDQNLPEDVMTFGRGYAVEPRYVQDIIDGMANDGLVVR